MCGWGCEHRSLLTPGSRARAALPLASFPPSHLGLPAQSVSYFPDLNTFPQGPFTPVRLPDTDLEYSFSGVGHYLPVGVFHSNSNLTQY